VAADWWGQEVGLWQCPARDLPPGWVFVGASEAPTHGRLVQTTAHSAAAAAAALAAIAQVTPGDAVQQRYTSSRSNCSRHSAAATNTNGVIRLLAAS
jgi:hypothetical protein